MVPETSQARVERLVRQYAQNPPPEGSVGAAVSLREQLGIESLALVSLVVRLGDELGVDVVESGVEIGTAKTVGDLVRITEALSNP
jgi:acyl carrier protein